MKTHPPEIFAGSHRAPRNFFRIKIVHLSLITNMKSILTRNILLAAGLLLLAGELKTHAQSFVPKAPTGTDLTAGASWTGNAVPGSGNIALWSSGSLGGALTMASSESWLGISETAATADIAVTGAGTLTLGTNGIDMSAAANNLSWSTPITLGGAQSWNVISGKTLTVPGAVAINSLLTINGTGTVSLSVSNNGAGGVALNSGTLTLGNASAAGTGTITLGGGTVSMAAITIGNAINVSASSPNSAITNTSTGSAIVNGVITGSGILNFQQGNSGATFTFGNGGMSGFSGTVLVSSASKGTLRLSTGTGSTAATFNLGNSSVTLRARNGNTTSFGALIGGATSILSGAGSDNVNEFYSIGGNGSNTTFSGVITNGSSGGIASPVGITKVGTGILTLAGLNSYTLATTINGGILNAGSVDNGTTGPFGKPTTAVGSILFGGGILQYSPVNQSDYSGRFDNGTLGNQPISIGVNGQSVTFATPIQGSGTSLTLTNSTGSGTLTLTAPETYTGPTTINAGTLVLSGSGALPSGSTISIGAGGAFDVSALGGTYTLGAGLNASGATTAATIVPASGGTFNLSAQPISLTWGGASSGVDSTHPAFTVSQGTLNFNNNTITVLVPGSALSPGTYTLISAAAISGTPNLTPSFGGNGITNGTASISTTPTSVILTVAPPAGPFISTASASPNPAYPNQLVNITATVLTNGATLNTLTVNLISLGGSATTSLVLSNGNVYTNSIIVAANTTIGAKTLTVTAIDFAPLTNTFGIPLTVAFGAPTITSPLVNPATASRGSSVTVSATVVSNSYPISAVTVSGASLVGSPVTLTASGNTYSGNATVSSLAGTGPLTITAVDTGNETNTTNITLTINPSTETWKGDGAANLWDSGDGGNLIWSNLTLNAAVAFVNGDTAIFDNTGSATPAVALSTQITPAAVTFNNTVNAYTISGSGGISGSATVTNNSGTNILSTANNYSGTTVVNGGVLGISSQNNVSGSPSIILNGGDLLGNGTFTLTNKIGIGLATGTAATSALVDAASGQTVTLAGAIASAGNTGANGLAVNSGAGHNGTVILTNVNTFNGVTVLGNGTLEVSNKLALQSSTLSYNAGSVTFGSGITAATLAEVTGANAAQNFNLTTLAAEPVTLLVGGDNVTTNYGGNLSGSGSLTKIGFGTLTLSNVNYTGNTLVSNNNSAGPGFLVIDGGTFGSASSTITVGTTGTLTTNENLIVSNAMVTANNVSVGDVGQSTTSSLNLVGTTSALFNNTSLGAANTAGRIKINTTGTVNLGNYSGGRDSDATILPNPTNGLVIVAGTVTATNVDIKGYSGRFADLNIYGGSLTIGNSNSVGAFKVGDVASSIVGGYLTMTNGTLTYLGTDGLLMANNATSVNLATALFSGGIATLTGVTLNQQNLANSVTNDSLTLSNGATLYLGSVGLVINQPNSFVFASFGTATVGAITNWTSVAPITLAGTTTFQTADASGVPHNIELDGVLSGTGGLVKTGGGTLAITGVNNTYASTTTVSNGTLLVNNTSGNGTGTGSVDILGGTLGGSGIISGLVTNEAGGTLAPGAGTNAAGTVLTINNTLTLLPGSTTTMKVTHVPSINGNTNDQVVISGAVSYGGVLTVATNAGDSTPYAVGDIFPVFNASGGYSGSFTSIQPSPGPGLAWTNYATSPGNIVVVAGSALPPAPVAAFTVASTNIFVTQTVVFTNTTTGSVTNSAWSFGNGSTNTSGVNNVSDTYNTTGTYQVILTASGTGGSSAATNNIVVKPKPAINKPVLSNGSLIFSVSNAVPGATFAILTYTNLATNVVNWTVATNASFDANGAFNYTNTPLTNAASFFRLKSPYP
jgi:autotransporter-associated beta strand protein